MARRSKRNLNFLPAEPRAEPVIDISAYPVDIGVGELMRLTRERLGHELQSVANQLRIRLSYLEAIEEGRFRDLPGTTYAVGFVRSYADYLGLDGADIVRRFREEAARIHGQTKLVLPALSADFLLSSPAAGMTAGGIFPAIVGTLWLVGVSLLVAAPIGIMAAIYLNEYAPENWMTRIIHLAIVNLAGVPSIVHALFGVGAFVLFLHLGTSILSASLTLAVMTLPVIIASTKEALREILELE